MDFLKEDDVQFSNGSSLENLHYVVFARAFFFSPRERLI